MNNELLIRRITKDDANALRKSILASQDSMSRYLCWAKNVSSWPLKVFKGMVRNDLLSFDKFGTYVAVKRNQIVGYASFSEAWDEDGLQIVYWVHQDFQRQGIAKELVQHLWEQAFMVKRVDYLEIHVADGNYGSHQVAKHFQPYATSFYTLQEGSDRGYAENGAYTVYYIVNPLAIASYKAMELLHGVRMDRTFGQRTHTAPAYSQLQLAMDLMQALKVFNEDLKSILNPTLEKESITSPVSS